MQQQQTIQMVLLLLVTNKNINWGSFPRSSVFVEIDVAHRCSSRKAKKTRAGDDGNINYGKLVEQQTNCLVRKITKNFRSKSKTTRNGFVCEGNEIHENMKLYALSAPTNIPKHNIYNGGDVMEVFIVCV